MRRTNILAELGEWTFYEILDHGFKGDLEGVSLYSFTVTSAEERWADGTLRFGEMYATVEHAMVAAVGEKYTGSRGAGGTGVGTAADWFMQMIGADQRSRAEMVAKAGSDPSVVGIAEDAGASQAGPDVADAVLSSLDLGRKIWNGYQMILDPAEH